MEKEIVELFEAAKKAADAANVDSPNNADICRCIDSLKQLKSIPVTSDLLVSTQVGKRLRSLTKHPAKAIGVTANEVLDLWKKIVKEETVKKKSPKLSDKLELLNATRTSTSASPKATSSLYSIKTTKESTKHRKAPVLPKLATMVKCNNDVRDKVRELLLEALSKVKDEVDENIREDVEECDPIRVAVSVETVLFEKLGLSTGSQKMKYRSIMFNLKDQKNPDLRRKMLLGLVKPEELVAMSADEMASDKRQMENKQIKEKALFDCERGGPPKATTDQFRCGRCGQRKTTYYQMQTRSADEPMTTYVTCVNCNNHWKFC